VEKLVRAGHRSMEIAVNYQSRSFSQGKTLLFFQDPLTWLRACFKYRLVRARKTASPRSGKHRHHQQHDAMGSDILAFGSMAFVQFSAGRLVIALD
jgi:hypothetical protein